MKILKVMMGLIIMPFSLKVFRPKEVFKNKRVAVVGAANSAFENELGNYIDNFDFVVRINKAPHTWTEEKSKFIGKKTDVWFHNFFENTDTGGGGPLNINFTKELDVKYLVNPLNHFGAYRRTYNFYKKYLKFYNVYHLPINFSRSRDARFGELKPTIGFTALNALLNSECKELFITGFTFWKTPYVKGYRDHVLDLEDNRRHFREQGIHNAELEYELFKADLSNTSCKLVQIDDKLREILINDETFQYLKFLKST